MTGFDDRHEHEIHGEGGSSLLELAAGRFLGGLETEEARRLEAALALESGTLDSGQRADGPPLKRGRAPEARQLFANILRQMLLAREHRQESRREIERRHAAGQVKLACRGCHSALESRSVEQFRRHAAAE